MLYSLFKQTITWLKVLLPAWLFLLPLTSQADYTEHPGFTAFKKDVLAKGIYPEDKLMELMASAQRQEKILEAMTRPAENTMTWGRYRKIFIQQSRIDQGLAFYKKHQASFDKASKDTGVPPQIILAILGVESRYGKHRGKYRVVDALATLGFDYPRRSSFFLKQLKAFLHLEQEAHIDLATATGSYAGAIGLPQFIPSSYRHYAVDFDNDGVINLIDNPADAIGSIANYFKMHGWKKGGAIASKAQLLNAKKISKKTRSKLFDSSLKPTRSLQKIEALGLMPDAKLAKNQLATAMNLNGESGAEYWIGLHNFYVITRYNHSKLYAMAVYQLSQELEKRF